MPPAPILILGSPGEYHAQFMLEKLQTLGQNAYLLDTREFPVRLRLNLTPGSLDSPGHMILPEGTRLNLAEVKSVYWRYHHGVEVPESVPPEFCGIVHREIDSALGSLFRNMPQSLWVNSYSAIERHRYKTHQLKLLAEAGIPIPQTLVTNDPEALREFYEANDKQVIFKPVAGGAHTEMLKEADFESSRLSELSVSPVQFQACVPGADVRVYVIDDFICAAEIQAGTLDFRDNPDAPIVPVEIPDEVKAQCLKLADLFEYHFTGIDIKHTPDGRYVFLEGNPSPMFAHFEKQTGFAISDQLAKLLIHALPVRGS